MSLRDRLAAGGSAGAAAPKSEKADLFNLVTDLIRPTLDVDLLRSPDAAARDKYIREKASDALMRISSEQGVTLNKPQFDLYLDQIVAGIVGLGPLERLLKDPEISEIMVCGARKIFIEKKGQCTRSDVVFKDEEELVDVIEKIMKPLGRRCDAQTPYQDARLMDGSRVNAVIRPLSIDGPALTIRKFKKEKMKIVDLIRFGSITQQMGELLRMCVEAKLNIIISGGTGSGKTTLLNVLSGFIPPDDRIVTIEDAAELQLQQDHVVRLETRPPDFEGKGEVTIRDMVKNSLRMRPDRIVVGECRGGEAMDMLQAMNTGHDGSMTTLHANSPKEALRRLETLVMMAGFDLPLKAIRQQVSTAVDCIIQQSRLSDGSRRVTYITEIQGMEGEEIILQDIFIFEQKGRGADGKIVGSLKPLGLVPKFIEKFKAEGIEVPQGLFMKQE